MSLPSPGELRSSFGSTVTAVASVTVALGTLSMTHDMVIS
jgi:hypothetical protein